MENFENYFEREENRIELEEAMMLDEQNDLFRSDAEDLVEDLEC